MGTIIIPPLYSTVIEEGLYRSSGETMEGNSEVARLLESIRLSYESAYLAMHGPAIVGHDSALRLNYLFTFGA